MFFDVETGGIDPHRHPIIQIAAVAFDEQWRARDRFEVKLHFKEADCDPEALKKVCYDRELWTKHSVDPLTAHDRFSYFLSEHATVEKHSRDKDKTYHVARLFAHNAKFDTDFLWTWHCKLREQDPEIFLPADRLAICTLQTALVYFDQVQEVTPPKNFRLGTLCEYFDIPFSTNQAHDASYDSLKTAELYHAMTANESEQIQLAA